MTVDCVCRICGRMRPYEKIKTVVRKAEVQRIAGYA